MDTNLIKDDFKAFTEFQVVPRPQKSCGSKYDALLKGVSTLANDQSFCLPLIKYGLTPQAAKNLLINLRQRGKSKYNCRIGGTVKGQELYLWRNPN